MFIATDDEQQQMFLHSVNFKLLSLLTTKLQHPKKLKARQKAPEIPALMKVFQEMYHKSFKTKTENIFNKSTFYWVKTERNKKKCLICRRKYYSIQI